MVAITSHAVDEVLHVTLDVEAEDSDNDLRQQLNSDTMEVTPEHPVYIEGKGWLWGREPVDWRPAASAPMAAWRRCWRSSDVSWMSREVVYNFTVKGPHTYFVLEAGVLVHNCGPQWDKNVKRWRDPETGQFAKSPDDIEMITDPETGLALPKRIC